MARLEDLKRGSVAKRVVPEGSFAVVDAEWHDADAATLVYRDGDGASPIACSSETNAYRPL